MSAESGVLSDASLSCAVDFYYGFQFLDPGFPHETGKRLSGVFELQRIVLDNEAACRANEDARHGTVPQDIPDDGYVLVRVSGWKISYLKLRTVLASGYPSNSSTSWILLSAERPVIRPWVNGSGS